MNQRLRWSPPDVVYTPIDVTSRDIDIPFTRVVKILFTWVFAWTVVTIILAIPAVILWVIIMVALLNALMGGE